MRSVEHSEPIAHSLRTIARVSGFTLIEVLAALIIVSLGMLGVIEAVSQTARNDAYLRDKTIAHWVAMNQLTKVRLETRAPKIDKSSDEVEMAQRRWRWNMVVTQTPVETVRRIDISVAPAEASKESAIAKVSGFYGTAIAPSAPPVAWSNQGGLPGGNGAPDEPDKRDDKRDGKIPTPSTQEGSGDPTNDGDREQ